MITEYDGDIVYAEAFIADRETVMDILHDMGYEAADYNRDFDAFSDKVLNQLCDRVGNWDEDDSLTEPARRHLRDIIEKELGK